MDSVSNSDTKVQHVNKKSSDELLRKFAEADGGATAGPRKVPKRRKRSNESAIRSEGDESPSSSLAERRSLLAPTRKSALLRQLRVHSRAQLKAREIRHRSLFGAIEKTWRRTIEGASKVFVQKHYNRHKRLINDIV